MQLLLKEENDKWILKQYSAGTVVGKRKAGRAIDPNVNYEVAVSYDGTAFRVFVDGSLLITMPAAVSPPSGNVGFKVKRTQGTFKQVN